MRVIAIGDRIGKLTVKEHKGVYSLCVCDCGRAVQRKTLYLKTELARKLSEPKCSVCQKKARDSRVFNGYPRER